MSILELKDVSFSYTKDKMILEHVNITFEAGKIYAIKGKSGSGKTTLLSLLSLLTKPMSGDILFEEQSIKKQDPYDYRSQKVGVIFQAFNLLPQLNAIENVVLSMDISKQSISNKRDAAIALLDKVGISRDDQSRPILKLSGGQQQRVAIARAISYHPNILLADEPTGNLDSETEDDILNIFQTLAYQENKCIIMVTHSKKIADSADVVYNL